MAVPPAVTVLMPVYNAGRFLREAIESVLCQSWTDFELLVLDDGSTDDSAALAAAFGDARIRVVHNESNLRLVATLNRGLELAHGRYVARMDADDICLPQRLARQVSFLERHPEVGVCGTQVRTMGAEDGAVFPVVYDHERIVCCQLFESALAHPTVMMRREALLEAGLRYSADFPHAEDYELWVRCARHMRLANIPEVLLHYRRHEAQVGSRHARVQAETCRKIHLGQLRALGLNPTREELAIHDALRRKAFQPKKNFVGPVGQWLVCLQKANCKTQLFPEPAFAGALLQRWYRVCRAAVPLGMWTWKQFAALPVRTRGVVTIGQRLGLFRACVRATLIAKGNAR